MKVPSTPDICAGLGLVDLESACASAARHASPIAAREDVLVGRASGRTLADPLLAGYLAVVRFLAYLDLRTRHEGWELDLQLKLLVGPIGRLIGRVSQWGLEHLLDLVHAVGQRGGGRDA